MIALRRVMKPWYVWRPWQLARRIRVEWTRPMVGYRELPVAWGVSLLADPTTTIGWSISTAGVHELAVTEVLARLIQPGDTVVDAGAHVGYMTILAALTAGPRGRVLSWEPHPELFKLLQRNVAGAAARHRLARVTMTNAALAATTGRATLAVPGDEAQNDGLSHLVSAAIPPVQSYSVATQTIDEALNDAPVAVMKLDVEGSERAVLGGASRSLAARRIRHIVFEEHQGPVTDVTRLLESHGYAIVPFGWSIRGLQLGPVGGTTMAESYEAPSYVATLAVDEVRSRCRSIGWRTLRTRFARRGGAW